MGMELPPAAIYHVEQLPDVSIRDGVVCCVIRSGNQEFEFRCTPHVMLGSVAQATRAWGEYIRRPRAPVDSMGKRRA